MLGHHFQLEEIVMTVHGCSQEQSQCVTKIELEAILPYATASQRQLRMEVMGLEEMEMEAMQVRTIEVLIYFLFG